MATWPNKKQHNNNNTGHSRPHDSQSLNDRFDMLNMAQSDLCHRLERAEYTIEQLLKIVEELSKKPA